MSGLKGKLDGKVALVTGGSRGIGAAVARRLASEGAAVSFTYASSEESANGVIEDIHRHGGRSLAIRADSADMHAVRSAVGSTAGHFGRLGNLLDNAAM